MNYGNPRLQDKLAAEYVVGTLTGRARARVQRLLKYDVALRRSVAAWESRLAPLAERVPAVMPSARVWRAIAARIAGRREKTGIRASLGLWRGVAAVSTAFVILLATVLMSRPPTEEAVATVAVLADGKAQPVMVISWPPPKSPAQRQLKVKFVTRPEVAPGKSFELWMLPGGNAAPVSLGVISADLTQTIRVTESASRLLPTIWGMAISVEPLGGSPTGQPTGPVILTGQCVKII